MLKSALPWEKKTIIPSPAVCLSTSTAAGRNEESARGGINDIYCFCEIIISSLSAIGAGRFELAFCSFSPTTLEVPSMVMW